MFSCKFGYLKKFLKLVLEKEYFLNEIEISLLYSNVIIQYNNIYHVGAILVRQTVVVLLTGNPLIEGRASHSFTFNLAVYPDTSAMYNVVGTNLWMVTLFLNTQQDGTGERLAQTTALLSSEQMSASWIPPNTMNIQGIQALLSLQDVTCREMLYVCASIDRARNPSTTFYMQGTPTNSSLVGCTTVSCTGKLMDLISGLVF